MTRLPVPRQRPHAWERWIPEVDRLVYEQAGFGRRLASGDRPAVLVIDTQYRLVGVQEAAQGPKMRYPMACGASGLRAVASMTALIDAARSCAVPVFYAVGSPSSARTTVFVTKAPSVIAADGRGNEIVAEVAPKTGDVLIHKAAPSAFFGTTLHRELTTRGVDTLLLCGGTTSGCIRATATDAASHGLRPAVVEECVFDRSEFSHAVSLFEIEQKYGSVIWLEEAVRFLRSRAPSAA